MTWILPQQHKPQYALMKTADINMTENYDNNYLVKLSENDNIAVCVKESDHFKLGQKYSISPLNKGSNITKYGNYIGTLSNDVKTNELINEDNLHILENINQKAPEAFTTPTGIQIPKALLYPNKNHFASKKCILIIATVSCVNRIVNQIAFQLNQLPTHDTSIIPITHSSGCGHIADSIDITTLKRTINGYLRNPNCFRAIVIGLGCEDNHFDSESIPDNSVYLEVQKLTEKQLIFEAVNISSQWIEEISQINRIPTDISNLTFALQCGGSDGLSAITANPLLGYLTSLLLENGAKVILSESTEANGFENELAVLCKHDSDRKKLNEIFKFWKQSSTTKHNPAPGNYKGGISSSIEKSVGSIIKFGFNKIDEVLHYGEKSTIEKGMIFMDSPGYDPCSITGQIASGANVLLFSTGRGSNYINSMLPTIKIFSNSESSQRLSDIADFDAQKYITEYGFNKSVAELLSVIVDKINNINQHEYIHSDFVVWNVEGSN